MADSVGEAEEGGKGAWPSGPTRSKPKGKGGKGKSPNSPSVPWPGHWAFKNPKGVAYCRDHHLHNKCWPFPQLPGQEGCDAPPSPQACPHLPKGAIGPVASRSQLGSQAPHGRQSGGQDSLRWGGPSPGCHRPWKPLQRRRGAVPARALQKGGSIPFPRTHQGSGKTLQREGRSKGGKNRQTWSLGLVRTRTMTACSCSVRCT